MDFDKNKYVVNVPFEQFFFPPYHHNFFSSKPPTSREELPSLEIISPSSSKGNYLQEFNHLDNQCNINLRTTNQMFGLQNYCLDPSHPSNYPTSISECLPPSFDINGSMAFLSSTGSGGGGATLIMPSFIENSQGGGHGGVLDQSYSIINQSPMITMLGSLWSYGATGGGTIHDYGPKTYQQPHKDGGSCTIFHGMKSTKHLSITSLIKKRGKRRKKKSNLVKGQWNVEEDRLLVELVESYGDRKWSQIAQMLNGRIGKQCRERWHNHLRPNIKKEVWSQEEEKILIEAHSEIGNKWAEIAKRLPGRTENSIKNHWNATKRRQFSRRKCRIKYPRQSSLLQDYIKNLNLDIINAGCRKKSSVIAAAATANLTARDCLRTTQLLQAAPVDQIAQVVVSQGQQLQASGNSDNNNNGLEEDLFVPNYDDFGEVPDFDFDDEYIFEENNINSFLKEVDFTGGTHGGVQDVDGAHMEVRLSEIKSPVI